MARTKSEVLAVKKGAKRNAKRKARKRNAKQKEQCFVEETDVRTGEKTQRTVPVKKAVYGDWLSDAIFPHVAAGVGLKGGARAYSDAIMRHLVEKSHRANGDDSRAYAYPHVAKDTNPFPRAEDYGMKRKRAASTMEDEIEEVD